MRSSPVIVHYLEGGADALDDVLQSLTSVMLFELNGKENSYPLTKTSSAQRVRFCEEGCDGSSSDTTSTC